METVSYLRFVLALVTVLGLMFALLWALRRWGLGGIAPLNRSRRRRLAVVEALPLDARHRLVLVRRDDQEHLLLLGGGGATVIERNCPPARFTLPSPESTP